MTTNHANAEPLPRPRRFWRRVGAVGFLFFLLKGLAWLLAPALIVSGLNRVPATPDQNGAAPRSVHQTEAGE